MRGEHCHVYVSLWRWSLLALLCKFCVRWLHGERFLPAELPHSSTDSSSASAACHGLCQELSEARRAQLCHSVVVLPGSSQGAGAEGMEKKLESISLTLSIPASSPHGLSHNQEPWTTMAFITQCHIPTGNKLHGLLWLSIRSVRASSLFRFCHPV